MRRPFTGARVETEVECERDYRETVAPSQGRELKQPQPRTMQHMLRRPFTGARVETQDYVVQGQPNMSPLHRGAS